jgi:hypothetical protein
MKRGGWRGLGLLLAIAAAGCVKPESAHAAQPVEAARPIHAAFIGQGSLEAQGEKTPKSKLALERLSVTAVTAGDVAETTIEHVFRNDADERLEGTFRFPLPEGAIVTGLAMEIDGRLMDGELVERDKARKVYEQIVDGMRDPALLEWESGQTFKLRVFPIEARKTKRVVLKILAPLHDARDGALYFAYRRPTADGGAAPVKMSVTVDGKSVTGGERAPTGELLVKVADAAPAALVERTKEGAYVVAAVHPAFAASPPPAPSNGQALVVLCDRSRSMLEARSLQVGLASLLLGKLEARDRFAVVTGDVRARSFGAGLHEPSEAERAAATAFVDGVEPDGASDVGALVAEAAKAGQLARAAGLDPVFVYLGDATATWGETRAAELARQAREALGGAALHVVVLGKSSDDATARALAFASHGRLLHPKTEDEARRAAEQVLGARGARRIDDVKIVARPDASDVDVPLLTPDSIYEGDDVPIAAFVPAAAQAHVDRIVVTGTLDGKPYEQAIPLASAIPARDVAKRWAHAHIEALERDGAAHQKEIIEASLGQGVMSRYTSFLVLESEEAYERFDIARKAKQDAAGDPQVSGRDLDSPDGRTASVSPDHLQPGDPELRIPAPADAQRVVVDLPFGETKSAVFESDDHGGSWVVRFLVDAHTPDGTYGIVVRITHADGHVQILRVPYVVDTQRPNLDVTVRAKGGGRYEIRATQRLSEAEIAAAGMSAGDARRAVVLTDAKRVEVSTPDDQLLSLTAVRLGQFVGTWVPRRPVPAHARLRVVAVDRALNERALEVEVP